MWKQSCLQLVCESINKAFLIDLLSILVNIQKEVDRSLKFIINKITRAGWLSLNYKKIIS